MINKEKNKKYLIWTFIIIIPIIVSFNTIIFKNKKNQKIVKDVNIYLAGGIIGNDRNYHATIWKNGILSILDNSRHISYAHSIAINGKDIYAGGYIMDSKGKTHATIWINKLPKTIDSSDFDTYIESMAIINDTLFATGWVYAKNEQWHTFFWKNGLVNKKSTLSQNKCYAYYNKFSINSFGFREYFDGVNKYQTGYITDSEKHQHATVWIKGKAIKLDSTSAHSGINSMAKVENTIYVVGWVNDAKHICHATLWKNGISKTFNNADYNSQIKAITIYNNDIYTAGWISPGNYDVFGIVWKNNEKIPYSFPMPSNIDDIVVINN